MIRRSWIFGGWLVAMAASAGPALVMSADHIRRNPLGKYVDDNGAWTGELYWQFVRWWLPVAIPVSLLALACMFMNRRAD
jgi:hypothetical protein